MTAAVADEQPFEPSAWATLATMLAETRETFSALDEHVLAYRQNLEAGGWSPSVAESMADRLHEMFMHWMTYGAPTSTPKEDT